jgi:dipeptidase E
LRGGVKPGYLDFAEPWIKEFFAPQIASQKPILFVPYARHDAISEEDYFKETKERMEKMGVKLVCAPVEGITEETLKEVSGIFIGGGHTYTLLEKLQKTGSLDVIRQAVENGMPYMGSSAGSVITCPTVKTCNDLPGPKNDVIDTRAMGLIGAQLNCHYMDNAMHDPDHQGETRDTRLKEFCAFNKGEAVLGLYEGQALRVNGDKTVILTSENNRGKNPPLFLNGERNNISCEVGHARAVSSIFKVKGTPLTAAEKNDNIRYALKDAKEIIEKMDWDSPSSVAQALRDVLATANGSLANLKPAAKGR